MEPMQEGLPRVLVIEDDVDCREVLVEVLRENGYRADGAENGAAALEQLTRVGAVDAIVLDLMMPVMDGATFLALVREHPVLARIPVVAVTAVPQLGTVLDVAAVLPKPVEVAPLLRLV